VGRAEPGVLPTATIALACGSDIRHDHIPTKISSMLSGAAAYSSGSIE